MLLLTRSYAKCIGHVALRGLGPGYWYGGLWFGVTVLHATKA